MVKTKEQIEATLDSIRQELDKKCDASDIDSVQNNLLNLQSLAGTCAEIIKECELMQYSKQEPIVESIKEKKTIPVFEAILQSKLAYELTLVNYSKNLFKAIGTKSDALRTVVALYRSELERTLKK